MTLAVLPIEKQQPVVLRPVFGQPNLRQWQEELDFIEKEVSFYRRLLKSGIGYASERSKPLVFDLLNDFSGIEDKALPELRRECAAFAKNGEMEQQQAAAVFAQKLERNRATLRPLKARAFALVLNLQKITIF